MYFYFNLFFIKEELKKLFINVQWLRALLSTRTKLKAGDDWLAYAIEQPEPLIHFALCSGNYSDPAVNI